MSWEPMIDEVSRETLLENALKKIIKVLSGIKVNKRYFVIKESLDEARELVKKGGNDANQKENRKTGEKESGREGKGSDYQEKRDKSQLT